MSAITLSNDKTSADEVDGSHVFIGLSGIAVEEIEVIGPLDTQPHFLAGGMVAVGAHEFAALVGVHEVLMAVLYAVREAVYASIQRMLRAMIWRSDRLCHSVYMASVR